MKLFAKYSECIANIYQVPRVFINGQYIGGGDETLAVENSGQLKQLIAPGNQGTSVKPETSNDKPASEEATSVTSGSPGSQPNAPHASCTPGQGQTPLATNGAPEVTVPATNGKPESQQAVTATNGGPVAMHRRRKPVEIKPSTPEELAEANTLIEATINNKKVMVFSKSFCPFCKKAKNIFQEYIKNGDLCEDDYDVMEIQGREDMNAIQNQLKVITGARSVCLKFHLCFT